MRNKWWAAQYSLSSALMSFHVFTRHTALVIFDKQRSGEKNEINADVQREWERKSRRQEARGREREWKTREILPYRENGRQKRKEVGWEDRRTGLLRSRLIPLQGFKSDWCVWRMGSLITHEKGNIRTWKTHRNMYWHVCTGVDIFSQLHCSLRLAHLHIRGSRTHYQQGEMKGAHGGRRAEGGDQVEKGGRLMLRRAAWHSPSSTNTHYHCVWKEFELTRPHSIDTV